MTGLLDLLLPQNASKRVELQSATGVLDLLDLKAFPIERRLANVVENFRAGRDTALAFAGDSTFAQTDAYLRTPWRTAVRIAAANTTARVLFYQYNDTKQKYDAPTVVQAGALGERYAAYDGNGNYSRVLTSRGIPDRITQKRHIELKARWNGPNTAAGNQTPACRGQGCTIWRWEVTNAGLLSVIVSSKDNTVVYTWTSTAQQATDLGIVSGADFFIDCQVIPDDGAGSHSIKLRKSADSGNTWTDVVIGGKFTGQTGTVALADKTIDFTNAQATATQNVEVGARTSNTLKWNGRVYWVQERDDIDGGWMLPPSLEAYGTVNGTGLNLTTNTLEGSPTAYVFNGAIAGKSYYYLNGLTISTTLAPIVGEAVSDGSNRFTKLLPSLNGMCAAVAVSSSHNDGTWVGGDYNAIVRSYYAAAQARCPTAVIALVAQNPEIHAIRGASSQAHNARVGAIKGIASALNAPLLDIDAAFRRAAGGPSAWVSLDGIHPNTIGSANDNGTGNDGYALGDAVFARAFGIFN